MIYLALLFLILAAIGATVLLYFSKGERLEQSETKKLKTIIFVMLVLFIVFLVLSFVAS